MKNLKSKNLSDTIHSLSLTLIAFIVLTVIIGCDDTPLEVTNYNPEPYLSAFLENGTPVAEVWLERMSPLEGLYEPSNTGERNAQITIYEVGGDSLQMVEDPDSLGYGRYVPKDNQSLIPESFKEYQIKVVTTGNEILEAETRMPGKIETARVVLIDIATMTETPVNDGDTLTRNDPNLYFLWETVEGAGGYKGFAKCLEPRDSTAMIPLDPDWDPTDEDDEIEDGDLERAGWTPMRNDQTMTTLPWIIFNWQGRYQVSMLAVSTEYYEYLFSLQRVMQGMINKPKYNVTGDGFGVFGAYSRWDINIYMQKVESMD